MIKISCNELKPIVKECGFDFNYDKNIGKKLIEVYHSHEWDYGYDSVSYCVNLDGSMRNTFESTRRQFYADMREMTNFLCDYIDYNHISELITAPLFSNPWISCESYDEVKDIYSEIVSFLKKNEIRKNSKSGISFDTIKNREIFEMLIEGSFRGVSNAHLLSKEHRVVIEPTNHFNFIFFPDDFEKDKKIISEILKKYPNLKYYEGTLE